MAMSPSAKRRHQKICGALHFALVDAVRRAGCDDCEVLFELDWRVNEDTVLRPDLMVICGHAASDYVEETPAFLCEIISDSSRERDEVHKREMYEKLGARYYLLVDPEDDSYTLLENGEDGFKEAPLTSLALHENCTITPDLSGLFS